jgi:hypothetical protein
MQLQALPSCQKWVAQHNLMIGGSRDTADFAPLALFARGC